MKVSWQAWSLATAVGLAVLALSVASAVADSVAEQPLTTSTADLATLSTVSVAPADLARGLKTQLYGGGTSVKGRVSLDLCEGPFPSEPLRTGRYQVAVLPDTSVSIDDQLFSVESIMYRDESAATQAMTELATAAHACPPSEFVKSGVLGDPPLNWKFNRAPDTRWKKVPGVQRLAFDVTLTDQDGNSGRQHLIYQRYGRIIAAVYGAPEWIGSAVPSHSGGEQHLVNSLAQRLRLAPQQALT